MDEDQVEALLQAFRRYCLKCGYDICDLDGTGYASTVAEGRIAALLQGFANEWWCTARGISVVPDMRVPLRVEWVQLAGETWARPVVVYTNDHLLCGHCLDKQMPCGHMLALEPRGTPASRV